MPGQKISSLTPVSDLQAADQLVLARSGSTYKITGDKFASKAQLDALSATSAGSFATKTSLNSLSAEFDNDYNNLLSLLQSVSAALTTTTNTLSTNMQNIGNYPYLEYAWVTAPNTAGQTLSHNIFTTLTLNTEVSDINSLGSLLGNVVTLPAGTYRFEANAFISSDTSQAGESLIYFRLANGSQTLRQVSVGGGIARDVEISGQFDLTSSSGISLQIRPYNYDSGTYSVIDRFYRSYVGYITDPSSTQTSHRVVLKLWKVG